MNPTEALPIWERSTAFHFIQLKIEANYQILAGIIGEELFRLIGQYPTGAYPFQRPELEESNPFHDRYMPGIPTQGVTVMVREYIKPGATRPHIENPLLYFRCDALSQNSTRLRAECPDERLCNIYKHVLDLLRREYGLDVPQPTEVSAGDKHDNSTAVANVSGGITLNGEQNYIGGDAVGRDKNIYIGSNASVTFVNGKPLNNPPSVPDGQEKLDP